MSSGVGHWINQRLTAILFLLSLIVCSFLYIKFGNIASACTSSIFSVFFATLLLTGTFHGFLGMQVIIQDYVKSKSVRAIILTLIACIAIFSCIIATFSIIRYNIITSIKQNISQSAENENKIPK